jgi:hypothetical protein
MPLRIWRGSMSSLFKSKHTWRIAGASATNGNLPIDLGRRSTQCPQRFPLGDLEGAGISAMNPAL